MGKKGKGNKLAKMSEEERARYLQMRADIEEEARRRKMQLISMYMKNKLKREDAFCRLNMAKINQEWRSILRLVKCQDLRNEMVEIQRFFTVALERKQSTITRLLSDLDNAEEMYAMLEQSYLEMIEKILVIQQERMAYLQYYFAKNKAQHLQECAVDFRDYSTARERAQVELESVTYQLELNAKRQFEENHEKFLKHVDDVRSRMQLRLENITCKGEEKLESLWQKYQVILSNYVQHTEGFYAEYMDLKERDEENTETIRDHYHEIDRTTDLLSHLKLLSVDVLDKQDVKISYLIKIKSDLNIRLTVNKSEVSKEIRLDADRFKLMSVRSHEAVKHLQKICQKGEVILQLSTVCRKYETEREKILPYGLPPLSRRMFDEQDDAVGMNKMKAEELKEFTFASWHKMEEFWKRVNNAVVEVVCLNQYKRRLEMQNAALKAQVQEYLVNLNISNGSNLHINDYLARRPSSMRVDKVSRLISPNASQTHKCHSAHVSARLVGDGGTYKRHQITNYLEANLSNAVRSQFMARGSLKLAKIETRINW